MSIADRVRDFICTNFYVPDPQSLGDDESLLEAGIVDSTGVVEIIGFLETEFGIRVEDAEIVSDNLDTVARIASYVASKMAVTVQVAG